MFLRCLSRIRHQPDQSHTAAPLQHVVYQNTNSASRNTHRAQRGSESIAYCVEDKKQMLLLLRAAPGITLLIKLIKLEMKTNEGIYTVLYIHGIRSK